MVLTNPPFGKKSSITIVDEKGSAGKNALTYEREDFWATTSNKQLNFLQHVKTILEINGRAAVVVPDNVLFEGGAGETIRRKLLHECDVHTLLDSRRASFTRKVSRQMCCFSIADPPAKPRGQRNCGFTTYAPINDSH